MCGIAGLIGPLEPDRMRSAIEEMTTAVAHRGPDGHGTWLVPGVAFGHRRLAIIDTSELGAQPMRDESTGCVITYNGEVYNYVELRRELEALGHRFRSGSDTEVILKAYDAWGETCVTRFNGMWAFALYDPRRRRVFCSRDRFGVKPFYYVNVGGIIAFGSEIRQLLPFLPARAADTQAMAQFLLARRADIDETTFFAGVTKLLGGHNLTIDLSDRSMRIERFFELTRLPGLERRSAGDLADGLRELLDDAVTLRLRSDVQVGSCLSGGLDSSSIVSLAAEKFRRSGGGDFAALTAANRGSGEDETPYARQMVERYGLKWLVSTPDFDDFVSALPEVVEAQEEPFASASIMMQFFIMAQARKAGIPVLLDGQGGDETLLGYERYAAEQALRMVRSLQLGKFLQIMAGVRRIRGIKGVRQLGVDLAYARFRGSALGASLVGRGLFRRDIVEAARPEAANVQSDADFFELQKREIESTNLPVLLRYEDKSSMWNAIETRLPFLDYRLVQYSLSLPDSVKIHDGWNKHILRVAMADRLPGDIVWRKQKVGFDSPESSWMSRHREQVVDTIAGSELIGELCSARPEALKAEIVKSGAGVQWRMYSVALWAARFGVSEMR